MSKTIGIRLQGKLAYCNIDDIAVKSSDCVVVQTNHGSVLAEVVAPESQKEPDNPPAKVVRQASQEDIEKAASNQEKEIEALSRCKAIANELKLKMKILAASSTLEGNCMTISFCAQERVDFRQLVRQLGQDLKTRVEMKQVGPRDGARLLGGIGNCGYPLCCQKFLSSFSPVSLKMAKEQHLPLNPTRISGTCGRLLCCLSYENNQYIEARKSLPRIRQEVITPDGKAIVTSINLLQETVQVKLTDGIVKEFLAEQLHWDKPTPPNGGIAQIPQAN